MCMKAPGPRCTSHAAEGYKRALVSAEDARNNGADVEQMTAALTRLRDARAVYDSTPGGQQALRARIEATPDGPDLHALQERLRRGEQTRTEQLAAHKAAHPKETHHERQHHGSGPSSHAAGARGVPAATRVDPGPAGAGPRPDRAGLGRRGHSDGPGAGPLIEGRTVPTVGTVRCPPARAPILASRGVPTPVLHELPASEAGTFRGLISGLKEGNPYHASVYVYDEDEYRQMRLFITDDGKAGFALKGDEVVSVYARQDSPYAGCSPALMSAAVEQGGRRLDCFDTVLPRIYSQAGFRPVARVGWDDEYAPDGWDYDTYRKYNGGRPDVVFMAYDKDAVDSRYEPGAGERVSDYDAGSDVAKARAAV